METASDIELFCRERGQGFPLILLHGNGEDSSYFAAQMDAFAAFFHVYALDTRGHGKSSRGEAPFTIRQFADDLLAFMDAREIGQAHILGFSDGANIALVFALAHPERVGKLILNGANLDSRGVEPLIQIPIELEYRLMKLLMRFDGKVPGLAEGEAQTRMELLGLMVDDPNIPAADLRDLMVPTLVVAGTEDMIRKEHTEQIAATIPNAELAILEGDHFVAAGNPTAFNKRVLDFLGRGEGWSAFQPVYAVPAHGTSRRGRTDSNTAFPVGF